MPNSIIQLAIDKMIQSDPAMVRQTIIELLIRETELRERVRELELGGKISHK